MLFLQSERKKSDIRETKKMSVLCHSSTIENPAENNTEYLESTAGKCFHFYDMTEHEFEWDG